MKRLILGIASALIAGTGALVAANLPNIPSTAVFAEANQIVGTLNALINQLNGGTGYSGTGQIVSLGTACTGSVAGVTVTCNGQRGVATFTGQTLTAATNLALQINNNLVSATSVCVATQTNANTIGAAITAVTPGAGNLVLSAYSTPGGATTLAVTFICM